MIFDSEHAMHLALEHREVVTNGVRLHLVQAGPADGPPVVLLHGFPEFWYGWRRQILFLAEAGYRVLAPDQRGYNRSEKPRAAEAYAHDALVADVVGLIDLAGAQQAAVAGHDWGGVVAWSLAERHPERVRRLVILNAPHPWVLRKTLVQSPAQMLRSWYVFLFQVPGLPEWLLRRDDWRLAVQALTQSSRPDTFGEAELNEYRAAWAQPEAIRSMLHWYRAAVRAGRRPAKRPVIQVPTLVIWGAQDRFLSRGLARSSIALCRSGRLVCIEEATHWVQHEEPDRVNALMHDFFSFV